MNIEEFKKLLSSNKLAEAQSFLQDFLSSAVSVKDQGKMLVALASIKMQEENTINQEQVRLLNAAISELSLLNKQHRQLSDAINLKKTRKHLE